MVEHKNKKNVIGMKINNLEILEEISVPYVGKQKNRKTIPKLKCRCICGSIFTPFRTNVLNNKTKQCQRCSLNHKIFGQKFGSLTVLSRDFSHKKTYFQCKCDCGEVCSISQRHLAVGKDKRCYKCREPVEKEPKYTKQEFLVILQKRAKEKHKKSITNKIGKTFHYLTVLEFSHWEEGEFRNRPFYKCECKCGNICDIRGDQLGKGIMSCGCYQKEKMLRGEDQPRSLHTNAQAREIRELFESGLFTQREISKMFNSNESTISGILKNKIYKDV